MKNTKIVKIAVGFCLAASYPGNCDAASPTILRSLGDYDIYQPLETAPVFDAQGALYGTATYPQGSVFRLVPPTSGTGQWSISRLARFSDAQGSTQDGVVLDPQGNVYGSLNGGDLDKKRYGTVFKITLSPSSGRWTTTVIHHFDQSNEGASPIGTLVYWQGSLYGSTLQRGKKGGGSVYKLTPPATGTEWTAKVLFSFGRGTNTGSPYGIVMDAAGSIYGLGPGGGDSDSVIIKLSPPASGSGEWVKKDLAFLPFYSFGGQSYTPLIFDASGALYGATTLGGANYKGTIFRVAPPASGQGGWSRSVLHAFTGRNDGEQPSGAIAFDAKGALIASTLGNSDSTSQGSLIKLTPSSSGTGPWPITIISDFSCGTKGCYPYGGVTVRENDIFGMTSQGGGLNGGVVYRYSD